jgi:hypothetical protein
MKNLLKTAAVALVIATAFISCDPPKSTTTKIDSLKKDSIIKIDSAKRDTTTVIKTVKKDTIKK